MRPTTRPMVYSSPYNWTPGEDGVRFAYAIGDECIARGRESGKVWRVIIRSELMAHNDHDGYVREVEFLDGSGTFAVDASIIEPSEELQRAIPTVRASLGLHAFSPQREAS